MRPLRQGPPGRAPALAACAAAAFLCLAQPSSAGEPRAWLQGRPEVQVLKDGAPIGGARLRSGDTITIRVRARASGGSELEYKLQTRQLMYDTISDWSEESEWEYTVAPSGENHPHVKFLVSVREGRGYDYSVDRENEVFRVSAIIPVGDKPAASGPLGASDPEFPELAGYSPFDPGAAPDDEPHTAPLGDVRLDPSFKPAERKLISEALRIYMRRGLEPEVVRCALSTSWRDQPPSAEFFEAEAKPVLAGELYIKRVEEEKGFLAHGTRVFFYQKKGYVFVAINTNYLGEDSTYWLSESAAHWAGVIGHEILHNIGYDHDNGIFSKPGFFIDSYGNCIESR